MKILINRYCVFGFVCTLMYMVFLLPDELFSANYYVSSAGDDNNSGLSIDRSWKTINKVNRYQFEDGDTVLFKRGDIFDDETLKSPDVDDFTFCDYGSGNIPIIGNNKNKPISILPEKKIKNLTLKNLDISGQGWSSVKNTACSIMNVHGLTVDGIKADGHFGGYFSGKNAFFIGGTAKYSPCSGTIKIRNCKIYNYGPEKIPQIGTDFIGILIGNLVEGDVEINDNILHDFNADGIQLFKSNVPVSIHDNLFYNFGENAVDVKSSSNVIIFHNKFTNKNGFYGYGGSGGGSTVGIHDPYDIGNIGNVQLFNNEFFDIDKTAVRLSKVKDIKIHDNIFDRIGERSITISGSTSVDINKNYFSDTSGCVNIKKGTRDVTIKNNIFYNYKKWVDASGSEFGCIYENNASAEVTVIHNNTFFNRSGNGRVAVNIDCSRGSEVHDNIFYQYDHGEAADTIDVGITYAGPVKFYGNCLYSSDGKTRLQRFSTKKLIQSPDLATSGDNLFLPADDALFGQREVDRALPPRLSISPNEKGKVANPVQASSVPLEAFRAKAGAPCRQKGVLKWGAVASP